MAKKAINSGTQETKNKVRWANVRAPTVYLVISLHNRPEEEDEEGDGGDPQGVEVDQGDRGGRRRSSAVH